MNVLRGADMLISAGGGIQNFRHIFIASLQGVASEGARLALGVVTQSSTLYIYHIYIEFVVLNLPSSKACHTSVPNINKAIEFW